MLNKFIISLIYIYLYVTLMFWMLMYSLTFVLSYLGVIFHPELIVIMGLIFLVSAPVCFPAISLTLFIKKFQDNISWSLVTYCIISALSSITIGELIMFNLGYAPGDLSGLWFVYMGSTYFFAILYLLIYLKFIKKKSKAL